MPLGKGAVMTQYAPATIKRIVVAICENPGMTVGRIAAACNLDPDRCFEVLTERRETLGLESDARSNRFYPKGVMGASRRTKADKAKFAELCQKCLDSLPQKLEKIAEQQAADKRRHDAYMKEKARQIQARKISWELDKELRAKIEMENKREAERQRLERAKEEEQQRRAREEESFRRQKLQSIKVMDVDALSEEITAISFTSQPEEVQEALTNQLLKRMELVEKNKPNKPSNIQKPAYSGIGNFIVFLTFAIAGIGLMAALFHDSQTPPGCDRLIFQPPRCSNR